MILKRFAEAASLALVASIALTSLNINLSNLIPMTTLVQIVSAQSPFAAAFPWMTSVVSGSRPKITTPPLVQFDMSQHYYKVMIESMMSNFKKSVMKANEASDFEMLNVTQNAPIIVSAADPNHKNHLDKVMLQNLQLEGIDSVRIASVYLSQSDMKLHVNFIYKSLKLITTNAMLNDKHVKLQLDKDNQPKPLLDASYWNVTWTGNILSMIGRDNFDKRRIHVTHSHQKIHTNLKDFPTNTWNKLSASLIKRVQETLENRLNEVMSKVMMKAADAAEEAVGSNGAAPQKRRPKRSEDDQQVDEQGRRILKRRKRQTPCQQGEELDEYVDQLFRFGSRIIRAMEPVSAPNITIELPDYNIEIFLYEGKVTRASKFRRAKSAWVFCSNETISLGITVNVDEARLHYKYRVISNHRLLFDGDLEAKMSPRAQIQFSQKVQEEDSDEKVQQRVDRLRVFRLGIVHVIIRGLGNLTHSLSMMINSYLNDNQEELQPTFRMVEGDATKFVNKMLANVNVPILSVV